MTEVFTEFCAAGLWPGVGSAAVVALRKAGIRSPADVTIAALTRVPKFTPRRADRLYTSWIGAGHLWELAQILVPLELPARWAGRLVDALGDGATASLQTNPWRLLVLPDATVAQADRLATALDPTAQRDDPRRSAALVDWTLARFARDGHTAAPTAVLAESLRAFGVDVDAGVRTAVAAGTVAIVPDPTAAGELWVARKSLWEAESAIADGLHALTTAATRLAGKAAVKAAGKGLDAVQAGAVAHAAEYGVSLLTGGPGTGKSRTVSAIVALCAGATVDIALAAPTGRAAKRLEELAGHPASTIHRLLGARPGVVDFEYNSDRRLPAQLVVVDEASMLDVELAAALISALPAKAHLVIVGDPAQLPSIGPGRVLGDLVDCALEHPELIPVTELSTLYRQHEGGAIARLATAVRGGELPQVDDPDREVVVVPARNSAEGAHRVVQLVTDSIPRVFEVSGAELQVVTPVHRGPAGTQALNKELKKVLNPGSGLVRGFDVGDRVVATANHLDAAPTGYANGEVGTIVAAGEKSLRVAFTGGEAEITGKAIGDLLHGWAITVHRAQGSEWDAVVAVMPPEAGMMLSRPLVYTALTRARRHLSVVHAAGPALARAVRQVGAKPRRTLLQHLMRPPDPVASPTPE
ncbi:MAG: AAA family ATPase [Actinomycetota bacterium]|nr:AAA family ATPase [Actinomycetota bacterium]